MFRYKLNKNSILVIVAVLAVAITSFLVIADSFFSDAFSFLGLSSSSEEIAKKSVDYINSQLLQDGKTATLVSFSKESGVVKMTLNIGGSNYDSYATRDGKLFFPEALNISLSGGNPTENNK